MTDKGLPDLAGRGSWMDRPGPPSALAGTTMPFPPALLEAARELATSDAPQSDGGPGKGGTGGSTLAAAVAAAAAAAAAKAMAFELGPSRALASRAATW